MKDPANAQPCTAANRAGCFGGTNIALRNIIPANRITAAGPARNIQFGLKLTF